MRFHAPWNSTNQRRYFWSSFPNMKICCFSHGGFFISYICKWQKLYLDLIFKNNFLKRFILIYLIQTLSQIIFVSSSPINCTQNFFLWNRFNSFLRRGSNRKWSKRWFHQYIDYYVLTGHGTAIWEELEQSLCGKENFDGKWRMTVSGWL